MLQCGHPFPCFVKHIYYEKFAFDTYYDYYYSKHTLLLGDIQCGREVCVMV